MEKKENPNKIEIESDSELSEEKIESLLIENESDATFTSTDQSQLPETECNLPQYIKKCLRGHDQAVISLCVHPTQKDLLVSGGMDDRLFFWSIFEERILGEMNLEETINQLQFSVDGKYLGACVMGGKFVVVEMIHEKLTEISNDVLSLDQDSLQLKTETYQVLFFIF